MSELLKLLNSSEWVYVTFRTKKGKARTMECSRIPDIPPEKYRGSNDPRLNSSGIICVYDYQNSAWRAFREDSVIHYEKGIENEK